MRPYLRTVIPTAAMLALLAVGASGAAAAPVLSLAARAQPSALPAGGDVAYTVTATNTSPEDAEGLAIRFTLPAGFVYRAGTATISLNGVSQPTQEPAVIGQTLTWNRLTLPGGRPGSIFGMHTFVQDKCDNSYIDYQLDRVREVAGAGAYVKELFYPVTAATTGPQDCWVHFVNAAYDRGLIPVVRLEGPFAGQYWVKPQADSSGGYATVAQGFKRVVAGLPRRAGSLLYVEVWNEPNLDLEWSGAARPAEYGRFLADVAAAIHSLGDSRIVVLNGALAPGGNIDNLAFIDALANVPGALQAFDVWASHPYPANHPPSYNIHDGTAPYNRMTIDSYVLERRKLAQHGRQGVRVLLTETGYALGNQDYAFEGYPPINEDNRATYIASAFRDYWPRWPEVLGATPFELTDPYGKTDPKWAAWDWLYYSGAHHLQYDRVAGLSKPSYSPAGVLAISFHASAGYVPGTYSSAVAAYAGGVKLAGLSACAPVTVQPGPPPPTPVPTPIPSPHCQEELSNRSFEEDADWAMMGGVPAGYSSAQVRTGSRSLRLGLEQGMANVYSYSSAQQDITLPSGPGASSLSFWYKPQSSDTVGDQFKVLIRDGQQVFHTMGYYKLGVSQWTQVTIDTTPFQGQRVGVRLTAVNDGYAGQTAVYVDDISWSFCPPRVDSLSFLPLILRGAKTAAPAAASPAALAAATPAAGAASPEGAPPAVSSAPFVVAASAAVPTSSVVTTATIRLESAVAAPAGPADLSPSRAIAIDPATGLAYAATGDGLWAFDPAGSAPPRRLLAGGDYRALAVDPVTRRLLASDWGGGSLVALDLASGRMVARAARLLRPSGIGVYGGRIYVAETGADRVVILDARTCGIIGDEPVEAAPYALAVDSTAGRVWVADAGASSVTVLDARTGVPIGAVQLDGLGHPQGIAVDGPRGRVYVTYLLGSRYHALAVIDARSLGVERVLRGSDAQPLARAYGVAVEPGRGRALLSDAQGLLAVDPDSLQAELILQGQGAVPSFGLAVDPARARALAAGGDVREIRVLRWP